jgi:hypothetical protein
MELVEYDEGGGRPKSTRTEINIVVTRRSMKETVIVLPPASMTLENITLNFWNYFIQPTKIMIFFNFTRKVTRSWKGTYLIQFSVNSIVLLAIDSSPPPRRTYALFYSFLEGGYSHGGKTIRCM